MACNGPFNFGAYCNPKMDELLKEARETGDARQARRALPQGQSISTSPTWPQIILFNATWLWGLSERVEGFIPNRDGLIRPQGLRLKPKS